MKYLAFDTSATRLTVAVGGNKKVAKGVEECFHSHSVVLMPEIENCLMQAETDLKDIDVFACSVGPGSFTGIRIGMCIAKVLASMKNIPLKAISSLNAYASLGKKIVILDAKAKRVYLGIYNNNEKVIDECVVEIETFKEMLNDYPDYDVVLDSFLIEKESETIDVIENMNRISLTTSVIENVDSLVPIYLKDR